MLTLGKMDKTLVNRVGTLAAHVVEHALASGLTWDQAILAFGVASQAIAAKAADQGSGTPEACAAQAEQRLKYGMVHSAEVLRAYLG